MLIWNLDRNEIESEIRDENEIRYGRDRDEMKVR